MGGIDFGGFNFSDSDHPPPPRPHGSRQAPSNFNAALASGILTLMPNPIHAAKPSHALGPSHRGDSLLTYHLPPIPLTYHSLQGGVLDARHVPRNTTYGEQAFPIPADMLNHRISLLLFPLLSSLFSFS